MAEINFYYEKAPQHLEIKVDGAIGGPAPTADRIAMTVYTERNAIPKLVVQLVNDDGTLGDEVENKREGKEGVVRVMQATLHMDASQAVAMRDWLNAQLVQLEAMRSRL